MTEAMLFTLDLSLVVYCCWIVLRVEKKTDIAPSDLGLFAFKEEKKDIGK